MKQGKVSLRKLQDNNNDYELLQKWYQQEEIYLHFEQRKLNINEIKNKYYPRTLDNADVPVYMIEYDNNPIGIIQYKLIDEENKQLYKLDTDNSFEIDIFIGELTYHNRGVGTISINLISSYLFKDRGANLLVMCPLKNNTNAIKCYQKCGFAIKDKFITEDTIGKLQEYVLMVKEK